MRSYLFFYVQTFLTQILDSVCKGLKTSQEDFSLPQLSISLLFPCLVPWCQASIFVVHQWLVALLFLSEEGAFQPLVYILCKFHGFHVLTDMTFPFKVKTQTAG